MRRSRRRVTAALVRKDPHAALTERDLADRADRLIDATNVHVGASETECQCAADELFRELFANDPSFVLEAGPTTRLYRAVREHAGKSLRLSEQELDDWVRVGALNQHLADKRWARLFWTEKLLLLPLTFLEDGMKAFYRGLAVATLPTTGTAALRRWVDRELPPEKKRKTAPVTYRGRGQLTAGGLRLADPEARTLFVAQLGEAPPQGRRRFVKDLREAHRNLGLLLKEIEAAGGNK